MNFPVSFFADHQALSGIEDRILGKRYRLPWVWVFPVADLPLFPPAGTLV